MSYKVRCEWRLRKRREVQRYTGVNTLSDLMQDDSLEMLKERYIDFVQKRVFKENLGELVALKCNELSRLEYLKKEVGEKQAVTEFLIQLGLKQRIDEIGGNANFKSMLRTAGFSESTIRRQSAELLRKVMRMNMPESLVGQMIYKEFVGQLLKR